MKSIKLILAFVFSIVTLSALAVEITLSDKQMKELSKYSKREMLVYPLMEGPNNPYQFNKDTIYNMRYFKILQKIPGGYLISTESARWSSGNSLDFGVAFLKTGKKIVQEAVLSGVVVYTGRYKYTAMTGYEKSVPQLVVPANLPLYAIIPSIDRFEPVEL